MWDTKWRENAANGAEKSQISTLLDPEFPLITPEF